MRLKHWCHIRKVVLNTSVGHLSVVTTSDCIS